MLKIYHAKNGHSRISQFSDNEQICLIQRCYKSIRCYESNIYNFLIEEDDSFDVQTKLFFSK